MAHAPLRLGMLSTAKIGGKIINALQDYPRAEIVAVGSRSADAAAAYCEKFGLGSQVRCHASYEALLADPDVDAIYNPLPNALHAEWTIKAAEAGKHILCEKPLASDAAECLTMIEAAATAGVVFMEAFMYRHHPATRKLRELIEAGEIGDVRLVRAGFCFSNNDLTNIRFSAPLAGGATMDVGCYCINFSRYLVGEEPATAYAVAQFGDQSQVDETLIGTLTFPSGAVSQFDCSLRSAGRAFGDVLGSKGTIAVQRQWFPDAKRAVILLNGQEVEVLDGGDPYQNEVDVFVKAIQDGEPLPIPPLDGAKNMAVVDAILASARSGKPVEVKPVG